MAELTGVPIPSMNWQDGNLSEAFRKFKQLCEFIFDGPLSEKDDKIKVRYLLLWAGQEGRDIRQSWDLSTEDQDKLDVHWTRFEAFVKPKSNFRVSRFQLRALKQGQGEPVDAFMTRARMIVSECEYNDSDEHLLDTLIAGVNNEGVQRKLISKDNTLTLDDAIRIVRGHEATTSQMSDIRGTLNVQAIQRKQQKTGRQRSLSRGRKQDGKHFPKHCCWNCGGNHARDVTCPAANSKCDYCKKTGHWAKVCIAKSKTKPWQANTPQGKRTQRHHNDRQVHGIDSAHAETEIQDVTTGFQTFVVDSVQADNTSINTVDTMGRDALVRVCMKVDGRTLSVRCKLDTGAQADVMPLRAFRLIRPDMVNDKGRPVNLCTTSVNLTAYNGTPIQNYGICRMKCFHGNKWKDIDFHITESDGYTMLGKTSSVQLGYLTLNCEHDGDCTECAKDCQIASVNDNMKTKKTRSFGTDTKTPKEDMISRFSECFRGMGLFPGEYHIELKADAEPVIHPPRRVPFALHNKLENELKRMLDLDVIEKVDEPTDWVNNLVYVTKDNGDLRICLDPSDLNKGIKREHYYTRTLEEILPKLKNAKIFSKLDARSGYWNVKLDKPSKLLTTFNTPFGRFCFRRLPFGLVSAQDVFQKKIDQMLENVPGVVGIADDIVVYGDSDEEHDECLHQVLVATSQTGLALNPDKCIVKQPRIKFFGNYLTPEGIEPDPQKVKAITEMKAPQNATELQSLLGMANYLSRFAPNIAGITGPLRDLVKHDADWQWCPEHTSAFDELKKAFRSSQVLAYYDATKPITVQTDASKRGIGATLLQEGRPVAFASKSLTTTESNYSNIEREMLAVVFGLERFHYYVYGRHVHIESDHKPLESITKKNLASAPPRLLRMLLRIQKYDFTLRYVPGRDVPVADALSRIPIHGDEIQDMDILVHELVNVQPVKLQQIKEATERDIEMIKLKETVMSGWPDRRKDCPAEIQDYWNYRDEIGVYDGIVLKAERVIIPKQLQRPILEQIHSGHQGIEKCRLRARDAVFWIGINTDIQDIVSKCSACQRNQRSQPKEPMIPIEGRYRWDRVGTDLFQWNGNTYLLIVDYYSSFHILRKLTSTTSSAVINNLKHIMSEYGIPNVLLSDNGPQFSSHEFQRFEAQYGFTHQTSSPHYPQANGKVERYVGVVKQSLQKALECGNDQPLALLALRTTPLAGGIPSPAEMMFGCKIKSQLPMINKREKSESALAAMENKRSMVQHRYDSGARPLPELESDQSVRIQDPNSKKWMRGTVVEKHPMPRSYVVRSEDEVEYRRNRRQIRPTKEAIPHVPDDHDEPVLSSTPQDIPKQKHEVVMDPKQGSADQGNHTYVTRHGRAVKPPEKLNL